MSIIKTEKLTKYYGKSRGIIDVDLSVNEGDFFGFIGPNGAGKSTTIRILLGLISKTSGKAEIFSKDISENKIEILSDIGYLPSETVFYNGMKVKDILALSGKLRGGNYEKEAKILCERLDLDYTRKVEELSFGNRKKVGIICALQHKPSLYILDEPTSGLDPIMQNEFYSILKERNSEGATVFLSSHILSEISKYCKTAAIIREGKLLLTDDVSNLSYTGVKRISLKNVNKLPDFENIRNLTKTEDGVNFLYSGNTEVLMKNLTSLSFEDITIMDSDLNDVFLHYYTKEEK